MAKKQPKKAKPKRQGKVSKVRELSDSELGQVGGGAAVDYYLKIDGVEGESRQKEGSAFFEGTLGAYKPVRRF